MEDAQGTLFEARAVAGSGGRHTVAHALTCGTGGSWVTVNPCARRASMAVRSASLSTGRAALSLALLSQGTDALGIARTATRGVAAARSPYRIANVTHAAAAANCGKAVLLADGIVGVLDFAMKLL